jgi:amphi-Trp domain-containing protein
MQDRKDRHRQRDRKILNPNSTKEHDMSKSKVSMKGSAAPEQVAELILDLATSMKEGKIYVQQGAEVISMTPAANIEMEIEASEKKGKQKISFEFEWYATTPMEENEPAEALKITSKEPATPAPEPVSAKASQPAPGPTPGGKPAAKEEAKPAPKEEAKPAAKGSAKPAAKK